MKTQIPEEEVAQVLASWGGAGAQVFTYHVTFRRLGLRLYRVGEPLLYLVAQGCRYIQGPFDWHSAHIEIERADDCKVVDKAAGFELVCKEVFLVRGSASDRDVTLDNFWEDDAE